MMRNSLVRARKITFIAVMLSVVVGFSGACSASPYNGSIVGDYTGLMICDKGSKRAEFKDPDTKTSNYYTAIELQSEAAKLRMRFPGDVSDDTFRKAKSKTLQDLAQLMSKTPCTIADEPIYTKYKKPPVHHVIAAKPESDILIPSKNGALNGSATSSDSVLVPSSDGSTGSAKSSLDVLVPSSH